MIWKLSVQQEPKNIYHTQNKFLLFEKATDISKTFFCNSTAKAPPDDKKMALASDPFYKRQLDGAEVDVSLNGKSQQLPFEFWQDSEPKNIF